jgi:hypothetical protein
MNDADPNGSLSRCLVITRVEAQALAAAEGVDEDGYPHRSIDHPFDSLWHPSKRAGSMFAVTTRMVLPYQEPTCAGAGDW